MSNAVATIAPSSVDKSAFEPKTLSDVYDFAQMLRDSGLCPAGFKNESQVVLAIMKGRELGMTVMQSIENLYVIKGRVSMYSSCMRGLILRSGEAMYFRPEESSPERVVMVSQRVGDTQPVRSTWDTDRAMKAGLPNSNPSWKKYPEDMLIARATSTLARILYPHVIGGLYTPDELDQPGASRESYEADVRSATHGGDPGGISKEEARERRELHKDIAHMKSILPKGVVDDIRGDSTPTLTKDLRAFRDSLSREVADLGDVVDVTPV